MDASKSTHNIYHWYGSNAANGTAILNKNNVVFANQCWQMIRTTDTGGVRLMYNGEPTITVEDGETKYDCSDNRNLYHMGGIISSSTLSLSGKVYADSYTATTSGTTTTFTLGNSDGTAPTTKTVTNDNASEMIGMYTCGNTSTTCTNTSFKKVASIKSGTTAYVYASTYRDAIGKSKYNSNSNSISDVGYMYNS